MARADTTLSIHNDVVVINGPCVFLASFVRLDPCRGVQAERTAPRVAYSGVMPIMADPEVRENVGDAESSITHGDKLLTIANAGAADVRI